MQRAALIMILKVFNIAAMAFPLILYNHLPGTWQGIDSPPRVMQVS